VTIGRTLPSTPDLGAPARTPAVPRRSDCHGSGEPASSTIGRSRTEGATLCSAESGSRGSRAPAEPAPPPGVGSRPISNLLEPQQLGGLRQQPGALGRSCPPRLPAPTGAGPAAPPRRSRRPRQPLVRPADHADAAPRRALVSPGLGRPEVDARSWCPADRPPSRARCRSRTPVNPDPATARRGAPQRSVQQAGGHPAAGNCAAPCLSSVECRSTEREIDAPMCCQGASGGAGRPVMGHSVRAGSYEAKATPDGCAAAGGQVDRRTHRRGGVRQFLGQTRRCRSVSAGGVGRSPGRRSA
jgi:hypothetical protein